MTAVLTLCIADARNPDPKKFTRPLASASLRTSYRAPWSHIPSYLLQSSPLSAPRVRKYSTESGKGDSRDIAVEEESSPNDAHAIEPDAESGQTTSSTEDAPGSTFQSLAALFKRQPGSDERTSDNNEPEEPSDQSTWGGPDKTSMQEVNVASILSNKNDTNELPPRSVEGLDPPIEHAPKSRGFVRWAPPKYDTKDDMGGLGKRSTVISRTREPGSILPPWKLFSPAASPKDFSAMPSSPTSRASMESTGDQLSRYSTGPARSPGLSSHTSTSPVLTHVTSTGEAHMVDVTQKPSTTRVAVACGFVMFSNRDPYRLISENANKKGDVLGVARIAGIMAAKRCSDIIPLCHPIPLSQVTVDMKLSPPGEKIHFTQNTCPTEGAVVIEARVTCSGSTGVEMEALTAVSGAALTVYDMCKAVDRAMAITGIKVVLKEGGASGDWSHGLWRRHQYQKDNYVDEKERTDGEDRTG